GPLPRAGRLRRAVRDPQHGRPAPDARAPRRSGAHAGGRPQGHVPAAGRAAHADPAVRGPPRGRRGRRRPGVPPAGRAGGRPDRPPRRRRPAGRHRELTGHAVGRFLFVVPPLTGHVNPTVPLGRELEARGHAVAWTGHADVVAPLLPPGVAFLPAAEAVPDEVNAAVEHHTSRGTRGPAGFMASWREFVLPVNRQLVPGVHAAVDAFGPDVLVVDQQALAGAAVAELRGVRWATCATTSAE